MEGPTLMRCRFLRRTMLPRSCCAVIGCHSPLFVFVLLIVLVLAMPAASEFTAKLTCPKTTPVGESPSLDYRIENEACSPVTVRVLSTMVGNGDETARGVAIFGPEVAATAVVPAAVDLLPGTCSANQCAGSFFFCSVDADCVCRVIEPGATSVTVTVPTAIPAELDGTVLKQFLISDSPQTTTTVSDDCLIAVPEAGPLQSAVAAMVAVALVTLRRQRGRFSKEFTS